LDLGEGGAGPKGKGRITVLGGLIRQQAGMLDGRLLTYAGARFEAVRFRHRDFLTAATSFNTFAGYESHQRGDQLVRGYEFDFNWRIGDTWSLNGSWGHVHSIHTNFGYAYPLAVGRRVNNVSPENGGVSAGRTPRVGLLDGWSANLGTTYVARTPTEDPHAGDTYTTTATGARVLSRTTYQWTLTVPPFQLWNAAIRSTTRTARGATSSFSLNLNNVFDHEYLKVSKQKGDRRAVYFTASIGADSLGNQRLLNSASAAP
jgi:outer membrane receptor for monomeric catechols